MREVHRALFPPGRGGGKRRLRLLLLLLLWLLPVACATAPGGGPEGVPRRVARVVEAPPLQGAQVGILAVEAVSGRTVVSRDAHRRFIPASNQKLLTVAAALHLLGPEHRWRTAFWSDAPLVGAELRGDLVLLGSGDPTLSDRWWPSPEAALEALVDSLRAAGVGRVAGRLVVDVSAWDSTAVPGSWEVGDLPFGYGAGAAAFAVAEGELRAVVRGGAEAGDPATLTAWWPRGEPGFLRAELTTAPADSATRVRGHHLPETGAVVLRGRVAAGAVDTLGLAAREPVTQAAALLRRTLEDRGIAVGGPTVIRWIREDAGAPTVDGECRQALPRCPGARVLAGLASPPLGEVAAAVLGPSQNWMAEQLLRTLGEARAGRGSREAGLEALSAFLVDEVGLDSLEAVPEDGSGMAARNLVTPRALVAVLHHARRSGHGEIFREALASPREEDTTLEERLPGLRGRLFGKTGSISNVDALSGYLVRDDGTELIFSILSNASGLPHATVRDALDALVRILAEG